MFASAVVRTAAKKANEEGVVGTPGAPTYLGAIEGVETPVTVGAIEARTRPKDGTGKVTALDLATPVCMHGTKMK